MEHTCPECGQHVEPKCEITGCPHVAVYEGWHANRDPVIGDKTGLIRLLKVCEDHKGELGV